MSNSDGPYMWKVIQGLNGTPYANSPNKAMSHDGWTITDIKSKAIISINHYARVSKLNMSHSDCDINWRFRKCINAPSVADESCAPLQMGHNYLPSKRWKVKEKLTLTTSHHHFSIHLALWPSRNYYPYSTHHFTCSLPTNLEGHHNHSISQSWEIS